MAHGPQAGGCGRRWRTTAPSGPDQVKDALRAFGEAMDDGFLEILEEVVAENRRDMPREVTLER